MNFLYILFTMAGELPKKYNGLNPKIESNTCFGNIVIMVRMLGFLLPLVVNHSDYFCAEEYMKKISEILKFLVGTGRRIYTIVNLKARDISHRMDDSSAPFGYVCIDFVQHGEDVLIRLTKSFDDDVFVTFDELKIIFNGVNGCKTPLRLESSYISCGTCHACTA